MNPQEKQNVAAVCGNEVRMYSEVMKNGKRKLIAKKTFNHHGAAVLFAQEYDESQRQK